MTVRTWNWPETDHIKYQGIYRGEVFHLISTDTEKCVLCDLGTECGLGSGVPGVECWGT